jgi:predicted transcriptional regulator of viral defense system
MEDNNYNILLRSGLKFFNLDDLVLLWSESNKSNLSKLIYYYLKTKKIYKLKSGLYTLLPLDSIEEKHLFVIAQKIITPSYITYHSALINHALNFQYYNSIHLSALYNKTIKLTIGKLGLVEFKFHKIKSDLLYSSIGIETTHLDSGSYSITSKERTVIESWYLNSNIGIDNLNTKFDKNMLIVLAKLYNQPRVNNNLKTFFNITI